MSIPKSRAYCLTEGIARTRPATTDTPVFPRTAASSTTAGAASACAGVDDATEFPAPSSTVISTIASPTFATVPASTNIFETTPVTGDGTSCTSLSFWTSSSDSSVLIESPSAFIHETISPSITPSPTFGSVTVNTDELDAAAGAAASTLTSSSTAGTAPSAKISIRLSPTSATSPSSTNIFNIFPLTGDGTSCTNLSFWISTKVSSSLIESPTATFHLTISPSLIPSPTSGILNINDIIYLLVEFHNI